MFQRILLDGRVLQLVSASGRLVGHGDDTHYVVTALHEATQGLHGKVGGAHIYDSQVFFLHVVQEFERQPQPLGLP